MDSAVTHLYTFKSPAGYIAHLIVLLCVTTLTRFQRKYRALVSKNGKLHHVAYGSSDFHINKHVSVWIRNRWNDVLSLIVSLHDSPLWVHVRLILQHWRILSQRCARLLICGSPSIQCLPNDLRIVFFPTISHIQVAVLSDTSNPIDTILERVFSMLSMLGTFVLSYWHVTENSVDVVHSEQSTWPSDGYRD